MGRKAAQFDVPEMPLEITGPDAVSLLDKLFARDMRKLRVGCAVYSIACNTRGGMMMDGIAIRLGEERYWYVQANGDAVYNLLWEDRLEDFDIDDQLASVSCPTLIVHGDFDPVPLKYAQEIHETIENSQLVILDNTGHFSYIETPAEFYSAVSDFLKSGHN